MTQLCIELGSDQFTLRFQVLDNPVAVLWLERMTLSTSYPLDDPKRFYGFNTYEDEIERATEFLKRSISTINSFEKIIDREFTSIHDHDCLNYLHHIFEIYHGLLDKQNHEFWCRAPTEVRQALANLNIAVHRGESVSRSNRRRFVCTWYGLPKEKMLTAKQMQAYGDINPKFGTVCLNYCEIGKTAEDLMRDDDQYIADQAFKPFNYFSADFVVRMFDEPQEAVETRIEKLKEYYYQHYDFFSNRGYTDFNSPAIIPYRIPVATLIGEHSPADIIEEVTKRQHITKVYFNGQL